MKQIKIRVLLLLGVTLVSSCATYRFTRRASEAVRLENWDAAVYYYLEALARDPSNVAFKMGLQRARLKAAENHFKRGMAFKQASELQRAQTELELAAQLDPTHQYAEVELEKVRKDLVVLSQEGGVAKLAEMKKEAAEMKIKPPALNPASDEPLSLSFPTERSVKDIYKAIGQAFGINILFDPKLRDSKLSIDLKGVTAREALEAVMQASGHFYKVLDEKTVIVVEDTPQNRRDYEDLVVKTFFLSNADVKDVNNMLRALIDARRIAVNEQLNSIVIRDTADKVAIAERLINANDKSKAEVLVDVELLQINTTKLRDIGTTLAGPGSNNYSYGFSIDPTKLGATGTGTSVPLSNLDMITRSMWLTTLPSLQVNLIKSAGEAETLAQPQLRITEHEKANLVIGDKVPIPTTTFNTSTTIGTNIVPITSFQYQDVGIKLEIEPRVHHNNEVTLKLKVEVSELGAPVTVSTGQTQPDIITRSIDSTIRLKDGETSLLAGLTKVAKQTNRSGMPWLYDLPIIGGLFGDTSKSVQKTDLVLTLTPHIIRYPDITEEDLAPLWVGTENRVTIFGNSPRVRSAVSASPLGGEGGPGAGAGASKAPAEGEQEPSTTENLQPSEAMPGSGDQPAPVQKIQPYRPVRPPASPGSAPLEPPTQTPVLASVPGQPVASAATAQASAVSATPAGAALSSLTFYPARLPVVLGGEAQLTVVLDPGTGGASGPLHFAYDPARLEVTRVEGGDLPGSDGSLHAQVTHTPVLGWISVAWNGQAVGSGTLLRLTVRPRLAGEVPIIFAGPSGAVTGQTATVVGLAAAAEVPAGEVQRP
jgi:general secretion pathway protein D